MGILGNLVPYSKYHMYMVVANNRFESPHSNMVEFTTKEGGEYCSYNIIIYQNVQVYLLGSCRILSNISDAEPQVI